LALLRTSFGRRRAYGLLAHANIEALAAEWVGPALSDSRIREDLRRFTTSLNCQSTLRAAERLAQFAHPALIAWSADDPFFPLADSERLAAALPRCHREVIERSRTFSMIDQPDRLATLIADFAGGRDFSGVAGSPHSSQALCRTRTDDPFLTMEVLYQLS
jgi:pimeloyl-ACP methyl ester carboxylesterase